LDQARFNELKRLGDQALADDDVDQLRTVLFELLSIQIHPDSGEGMFDIANIVKG
jgi:carbamoylphosphate synthase small subunit